MDKLDACQRRWTSSLKVFSQALLLGALLTACSSQSKKEDAPRGLREGQWHGNFSIKDKSTGKSNNLVMDALAAEPSKLRLEITTQLGIPVASIVMNGERLQALLPQQKKMIEAPATAQAMGKLARLPIEPQVLMDVLFDNVLNERRGWNCDSQEEQRCIHAKTSASVIWDSHEGDSRKFSLDSPRAEGVFSINKIETKVQFNENTFSVKAPSSYKTERF